MKQYVSHVQVESEVVPLSNSSDDSDDDDDVSDNHLGPIDKNHDVSSPPSSPPPSNIVLQEVKVVQNNDTAKIIKEWLGWATSELEKNV
jgi:hypothetical protein